VHVYVGHWCPVDETKWVIHFGMRVIMFLMGTYVGKTLMGDVDDRSRDLGNCKLCTRYLGNIRMHEWHQNIAVWGWV
jgi:hypothetical protein